MQPLPDSTLSTHVHTKPCAFFRSPSLALPRWQARSKLVRLGAISREKFVLKLLNFETQFFREYVVSVEWDSLRSYESAHTLLLLCLSRSQQYRKDVQSENGMKEGFHLNAAIIANCHTTLHVTRVHTGKRRRTQKSIQVQSVTHPQPEGAPVSSNSTACRRYRNTHRSLTRSGQYHRPSEVLPKNSIPICEHLWV